MYIKLLLKSPYPGNTLFLSISVKRNRGNTEPVEINTLFTLSPPLFGAPLRSPDCPFAHYSIMPSVSG